MGFLEKLMRSVASGHHDKHGGSDYSDRHGSKHNAWGNSHPQNTATPAPTPAKKACPGCGAPSVSDARYCGQCGQAFNGGRCSGCQTELASGAKFCPTCGKPVGT